MQSPTRPAATPSAATEAPRSMSGWAARLPSAPLSVRNLCAYRAEGGVESLALFFEDSAREEYDHVLSDLRAALRFLLDAIPLDEDTAFDFAAAGGHVAMNQLLQREMRKDEPDEDFLALLYEVASASSRQGVSFPGKKLLDDNRRAVPQSCCPGAPGLRIRAVVERQSAQKDTGFVLWPAATILAHWLRGASGQHFLRGHHVLEIGAGLGLTGLSCVRIAQRVTLSDYNVKCLRNLRYNVALNFPDLLGTDGEPIVSFCDFNDFAPEGAESRAAEGRPWDSVLLPGEQMFHRIVGADVICCAEDARSVAHLVKGLLAPGGKGVFVLADPANRYGVDAFPGALRGVGGLEVKVDAVDTGCHAELLAGLEDESKYLAWNMFEITRCGD